MVVGVLGCQKQDDTPPASQPPAQATASQATTGGAGVTPAGPDVGAVTPVSNSALDNAAGGGVNQAMLGKARGISQKGVGSVNNAEKQGYGAGDDSGG